MDNSIGITTQNKYYIELLSDKDKLERSSRTVSEVTNVIYRMDDTVFGSSVDINVCKLCGQHDECYGHTGAVYSLYPFPVPITQPIMASILQCTCSICSHIPVSDEQRTSLLNKSDDVRIKDLKAIVNKTEVCPYCNKAFRIIRCSVSKTTQSVTIMFTKQQQNDKSKIQQCSPCYVQKILSNFHNEDLPLFKCNNNIHPSKFMSNVIPICCNKLRPKSMMSKLSMITTFYINIINIMSQLDQTCRANNFDIPQSGDLLRKYNMDYSSVFDLIRLITDITNPVIAKNYAAIFGQKNLLSNPLLHKSLIMNLKGKDQSLFHQGIIGSRHNVCARTVLSGNCRIGVGDVAVPNKIANKLTTRYSVYKQNIKAIQQFIAREASNVSRSVRISRPRPVMLHKRSNNNERSRTYIIDEHNALGVAARVEPGDKLDISLFNGDMVLHSRFPALREESISSNSVMRTWEGTIQIHQAACGFKNADYDGDETNIYIQSTPAIQIENVLLNSIAMQMVDHETCSTGVWVTKAKESGVGMNMLMNNKIWDNKYAQCITDSKLRDYIKNDKNIDIDKIISYYMPKIDYDDGTCKVKAGVFTGKLTRDLVTYIYHYIGGHEAVKFISNISRLIYDFNKIVGHTFGEVFALPKDVKDKIKLLVDDRIKQIEECELSFDPNKEAIQLTQNIEKNSIEIKQAIAEAYKHTAIEDLGYIKDRQSELERSGSIVGQTMIGGERLGTNICNNARYTFSAPAYSLDPRDRGLITNTYTSGINYNDHFIQCIDQRHALYERGMGTATQGYSAKKLNNMFGTNIIDYSGNVVSNNELISFNYGLGYSPRHSYIVELDINHDCFKHKYVADMLNRFKNNVEQYSKISVFAEKFKYSVNMGFDYKQLLVNKKYEPVNDDNIINMFKMVDDMYAPVFREFKLPTLENWKLYIWYILHVIGYSENICKTIYQVFIFTLAAAGDPVGIKAALAIGNELTQESLDAIHGMAFSMSTDTVKMNVGLNRLKELFEAAPQTNKYVIIYLKDKSKDAAINFITQHEIIYISDIWKNMVLNLEVEPDILKRTYYRDCNFDEIPVSPYVLNSTWNFNKLAELYIPPSTLIKRLIANYPQIAYALFNKMNDTYVNVKIYFRNDVSDAVIRNIYTDMMNKTVSSKINGTSLMNSYLGKSSINDDEYYIKANIADGNSLRDFLLLDDVDVARCRTSDIHEMRDIFGHCEFAEILNDEMCYSCFKTSSTSKIDTRVINVISNYISSWGQCRFARKTDVKKNPGSDLLRYINYEEPSTYILAALQKNTACKIMDFVSGSFFGIHPKLGSGISDVKFSFPN